jgi:hypothetical protein
MGVTPITVRMNMRPHRTDDLISGDLKLSRYFFIEPPRRRSCGRTTRMANSITTGIVDRSSDSQGHFLPVPEIQFQYETAKPIAIPPINVNGRFFKRPNIAAAYAFTTSRVRASTFRLPRSGDINIPAKPARTEPMIQLKSAEELGLLPFSRTRS